MSTSNSLPKKAAEHKSLAGPSSRTRSNKVLSRQISGPASRTRSKPFTPFSKKIKEDHIPFAAAGKRKSSVKTTSQSLEDTFSSLDDKLTDNDFIDHLCLVRMNPIFTPPQNANVKAVTNPRRRGFVEENTLWPALMFNSLNELTSQIMRTPLAETTLLCDIFTSEQETLLANMPANTSDGETNNLSSFGVVYLLGRGSMSLRTSLLIVKKMWKGYSIEVDGVNLFCFDEHVTEMTDASGKHCGSEEFQHAISVAFERMEKCVYSPKECVDVEYSDLARQKIMNKGMNID